MVLVGHDHACICRGRSLSCDARRRITIGLLQSGQHRGEQEEEAAEVSDEGAPAFFSCRWWPPHAAPRAAAWRPLEAPASMVRGAMMLIPGVRQTRWTASCCVFRSRKLQSCCGCSARDAARWQRAGAGLHEHPHLMTTCLLMLAHGCHMLLGGSFCRSRRTALQPMHCARHCSACALRSSAA